MALHKVVLHAFIDGEGRDEETVATAVSTGCSAFGPISDAFDGFPEGNFMGIEAVQIEAPTEDETTRYSE